MLARNIIVRGSVHYKFIPFVLLRGTIIPAGGAKDTAVEEFFLSLVSASQSRRPKFASFRNINLCCIHAEQ
jgi:hypothetical protein